MNARDGNPPENDNAGVIMLPPLMLLIVLGVGLVLEFVLPVSVLAPFLAPGPQLIAGGVLVVIGGALAVWGVRTFTRAGTNVAPNEPALKVVTEGPYRFTRNPMYLGMLLVLPGLALVFSIEWYLLLWLPFFMVLRQGVVLREERYMETKFGTPYSDLLKRTRRWI